MCQLRGLGPWTAHYLALRVGDPDAFPASDLGLRRSLEHLLGRPVSARDAEAASDAAGVKQLDTQLQGTIDADLLNAFTDALRARYGVEIDEGLLNSLAGS